MSDTEKSENPEVTEQHSEGEPEAIMSIENYVVVGAILIIQCPPLYRITLGQHKSDNNNRMIRLTDGFYVLFMYKRDQ